MKTFETLYTVPVSVDKSKTIAMNATLQEQKPLVSGVTDFFVMSLPIFSDSSTRVDVLFDRYLFIYLFIYRFVQCSGERTIGHVVLYLVHPPNPTP